MFLKIQGKFREKHLFQSLFFKKVAGWKPETFTSSHWRCSVKQGALKNFANFTGKNLCWSLLLIKLHFWCLQLYQRRLRHRWFPVKFAVILKNIWECLLVDFIYKETPTQAFSFEFYELFRNTYFVDDLQTTSSKTRVRWSLLRGSLKSGGLKVFNSIRKRLYHRYFSVNFVIFLGKLLLQNTHLTTCHMILFFPFCR